MLGELLGMESLIYRILGRTGAGHPLITSSLQTVSEVSENGRGEGAQSTPQPVT